ncbi:MAG: hypothetical protein M1818_005760 [Claussenomyces sp. TS43310]|nr:MAG: hypothetical protein M1818_005760 [Claussenomyces sp. TS43310]
MKTIQSQTNSKDDTVPSQDSEMSNVVALDPDGDAILDIRTSVTHKKASFLISTKVLSLASPVFARMFGPDFAEGRRIVRSDCPRIELGDDDADTMETVLEVLHYRSGEKAMFVNAARLADLAIHCDKYYCTNALRPWISYWFSTLDILTSSPEELGLLLLAAYMFDNSQQFAIVSEKVLEELTPKFCLTLKTHKILQMLPASVQSEFGFQKSFGNGTDLV